MHKSRLYLTLSMVALLGAVVVSEFDLRCPLHSITQCPFSTQCDHPPIETDADTYAAMYNSAISARFDEAVRIAQARLRSDSSDATTRLYLAYSLRGRDDINLALRQYGKVVNQTQGDDPANDWIVVDALTGRAACHTSLGNADAALDDLEQALKLGLRQEAEAPDTRTAYQLSCLYAQFTAAYEAENETWQATKAADNAERYLRAAMDRGYNNRRHIAADLDLDPLRYRASFQRMLK